MSIFPNVELLFSFLFVFINISIYNIKLSVTIYPKLKIIYITLQFP